MELGLMWTQFTRGMGFVDDRQVVALTGSSELMQRMLKAR